MLVNVNDRKGPTMQPGHKANGRKVILWGDILRRPEGDGIDIHMLLTNNSPSVVLMPIHTNLMRRSGLMHGGIAVVDSSIKPAIGKVCVVRFNGDLIMRRLEQREGRFCFVADDFKEPVIFIGPDDHVERMGVVTSTIFEL